MPSLLRRLPNPLQTASYRPPTHPSLYLNIPAFGVLYIQPQPSIDPQSSESSSSPSSSWVGNEVTGELEVYIPPRHGARRAKAVKVGLRSTVKMGEEGKPWIEEVIFERELQQLPLDEDGLLLSEGTTKFGFTFPLPPDLAPHDWHPTGKVTHDLWACIETVENLGQRQFFSGLRRRSATPEGSRLLKGRAASPARAPSYDRTGGNGPSPAPPPSPPAYERVDSGPAPGSAPLISSEVMWLEQSMEAHRVLMLVYNPHPNGGVTDLDERLTGHADRLGAWELRMVSDVWCVGALLFARFSIPSPSPETTIVSWHIYLETTVQHFSNSELESAEPATPQYKHVRRHLVHEAPGEPQGGKLWRGTSARGKDTGPCRLEAKGRLPDDEDTRPSTLPHVKAPLHSSHALIIELYFSVWGEDAQGRKMGHDGPGQMRVLVLRKPTIVPNCAITPSVQNLPSYDRTMSQIFQNPSDRPCPLCKTPIEARLCSSPSCPPSMPPHPRHDHPPTLVGNEEGVCRVCSRSVMPDGKVGRRNCLCMVGLAELVRSAKGFGDAEQTGGNLRDELEPARKIGDQPSA